MNHFSIKDIETLTGIKPHTLRIWELRYGIPQPKRTSTNIRFYDDNDLKLLLNVAILNRNGHKISKITKLKQNEIDELVLKYSSSSDDYSIQIESLIGAMLNLDEVAFEKILSSCIIRSDFERAMMEVVFPFLRRVGILWQTGTVNPAYEHFLTNLIRRKLIVAIDALALNTSTDAKKFLLFLPHEEFHELGLLFAKYVIKKRGHKTIYLGQNLPLIDAEALSAIYKPDYVVIALTSSLKHGTLQHYINDLAKRFAKCKLILSGFQVVHTPVKSPSNTKIFKSIADLIEFLEKI